MYLCHAPIFSAFPILSLYTVYLPAHITTAHRSVCICSCRPSVLLIISSQRQVYSICLCVYHLVTNEVVHSQQCRIQCITLSIAPSYSLGLMTNLTETHQQRKSPVRNNTAMQMTSKSTSTRYYANRIIQASGLPTDRLLS